MAALGLFDVQGHAAQDPTFQFGSPLFDKVTIQLNSDYYSGKELVIQTRNNSGENIYIQSASFNGKPIEKCWIDRNELLKGGTLIFEMGKIPGRQWNQSTPPPSMSDD